jgi:SAM-dependent methyltransferase
MPIRDDLGAAYAGYYTHSSLDPASTPGRLKRAYVAIKSSYLAVRYDYASGPVSTGVRLMAALLYVLPNRREAVDDEVRYLRAMRGGRLLDVGTGSGGWLEAMHTRGWRVQGVDFDPRAVAAARRRGLRVDEGALEAQGYPPASFDAITLNHVIEHVPDPISTLRECRRVLKPGGRLVLVTPNAASLGHRLFRSAWRGLEPPRHLHIFAPGPMRASLARAGFTRFSIRTVPSDDMLLHSLRARTASAATQGGLATVITILALALTMAERVMVWLGFERGECLVVQAEAL